ncbi:MAG TPA: 2-amino-4-hydroxy-6-hydroxymethyldihydropteridine diphosphokinase [Steroidobacteraceae bacterium]|nr:2-amino-4-hydroxy-6-hydroxymethyldihydropteridine diphosphokinase [Steroidobacteraceae bacterium]
MIPAVWTPAYLGVGSNLDSPRTQVERGIDALSELPHTRLVMCSNLYKTAPVGPQDQPHFVNAVVGLLTQLSALDLLAALKALENRLGRAQPTLRWGPRVIDFDLLVFGAQRIESDILKVPHPGLSSRGFVLVPFLDVAPDLEVPGLGAVRALAARLASDKSAELIGVADLRVPLKAAS